MAYSDEVAHRVRAVLADLDVTPTEQQMFGGMAFMVRGHMTVGIIGEELMVRVGKEAHDEAVAEPHVREMDFTNRPMRGFVFVAPEGFADDVELRRWVRRALEFTRSLPPK